MSELTPNSLKVQPPSDGWELACTGILRAEFGRRQSFALDKAMTRLEAEESLTVAPMETTTWPERIREWLSALRPRPGLAFGVALFLVIGVVSWHLWSGKSAHSQMAQAQAAICTLSGEINAHWADGSAQPKIGDVLPSGSLHLESGVVELTFASTAKIAVEGPAQFELTGRNSLDLENGKLATDVPRRARGFAVKTPTAKVVDLGTRFGLTVNDQRVSEVDVFEGRVELMKGDDATDAKSQWLLTQGMAMTVDRSGGKTVPALSETAYAQPSRIALVRPQNCGFDVTTIGARLEGIPTGFGYWSGSDYALTGPVEGINPVSGPGMLRFLTPRSPAADSEVWQLIDLRPYKELLAGGDVQIKSSAMFNRVRGDARSGGKFGLTVAAFHGLPANAASLWAHRNETALAVADKELVTDDNPQTWEKVEADAMLPAGTDFLIVGIRAIKPDGSIAPFPGNFADLVDVYLCLPLRAGTVAETR